MKQKIPSWLTGGMIVLGIATILANSARIFPHKPLFMYNLLIFYVFPVATVNNFVPINISLHSFLSLFTFALFYFIIGALIGLIVSKIKSIK